MAIKHSYNLTELKEEVITAEIVLQVLKENPDNFTFFIRQTKIGLDILRDILRDSFVKEMFLTSNLRLLSSYTIGELLAYEDLIDFCVSYSAKFSLHTKEKLSL